MSWTHMEDLIGSWTTLLYWLLTAYCMDSVLTDYDGPVAFQIALVLSLPLVGIYLTYVMTSVMALRERSKASEAHLLLTFIVMSVTTVVLALAFRGVEPYVQLQPLALFIYGGAYLALYLLRGVGSPGSKRRSAAQTINQTIGVSVNSQPKSVSQPAAPPPFHFRLFGKRAPREAPAARPSAFRDAMREVRSAEDEELFNLRREFYEAASRKE